MKILVVEDDSAIAQTLQYLFSGYSYAVDVAADGETGWQMVQTYDYDLILLDVMLPGLDGISLCRQIRAARYKAPILLLTGQEGGHQKAIALNAGADDYVVKPFDTQELIARVQALLRRGLAISQPILTWGQLSLDPSTRRVAYGTQLLSTTPKEYAILELLLRNPQKTLSSKTILDQVWSSLDSPGEEAIRVHIKQIRQKLTAIGTPKDLIKTVYRTGYQLNPLYASVMSDSNDEPSMLLQIAELKSVNQELRITLEELRATQEELYQQNAVLAIARHQMEQQQQRYQDLFEFAPDGYLVTDPQGIIQQANRLAAGLLGMDGQDLVGKSLAIFLSRFDRPIFRTQLDRLNPEEMNLETLDVDRLDLEPDWEALLQPRTGEPFLVLIAATSIRNSENQITGLRWSLRDIRHHKPTQMALQKMVSELQALYSHAPLGHHSLDAEGRMIQIDDIELAMLGYSRAEMVGRKMTDFLTPESVQAFTQNYPRFKQRGWLALLKFHIICKNGSILTVGVSATAVYDAAGNFLRSNSVLIDTRGQGASEFDRQT